MRLLSASLLAVVLGLSWIACVGDDPVSNGSGPATGDRLGPCFSDKKCKEGLECREPELICLTPGEPTPPPDGGVATDANSGADGSSSDDSGTNTDGSGDSSTVDAGACALQSNTGTGPYCGEPLKRCTPSLGCCGVDVDLQCLQQAACPTKFFECDGREPCGSGEHCCAAMPNPVSTGTPSQKCKGDTTVPLGSSQCVVDTTACGYKKLCRTGNDCPGSGFCRPTEVVLGSAAQTVVWGICD